MTRVSLKEAYDNKDVVAQIYAIRDTAESAEDSAEQAVTTANTASEHVDALVPQVEGAVENANSASASAQASAQTVAGYENRLGAVEGDVVQLNTDVDGVESDLSAVTLRVTTAEGQIVTIQGRVTALETADGQNVKINAINDYAVGLTGNQNIRGNKVFLNDVLIRKTNPGYLTVDEREFSTMTNSQTTGNRVVSALDNGTPKELMMDQIRVSGFGITGGVERMMWTYCKVNDVWKYVILRVQMNPETGKAQLRFGNTVIAEVDI